MTPIRCDSHELSMALAKVKHAVASDESRPILAAVLAAVLFEGDEQGLRLVAADNYRIAIATVDSAGANELGKVAVRASDLPMLKSFLGIHDRFVSVERGVSGPRPTLIVRDDYRSVALAAFDGTYPDYRSITDKSVERHPPIGVNPSFLVDAAKAASDKALVIKIELPVDPHSTVIVKSDGLVEHIMPVRLAENGPFQTAEPTPTADEVPA